MNDFLDKYGNEIIDFLQLVAFVELYFLSDMYFEFIPNVENYHGYTAVIFGFFIIFLKIDILKSLRNFTFSVFTYFALAKINMYLFAS